MRTQTRPVARLTAVSLLTAALGSAALAAPAAAGAAPALGATPLHAAAPAYGKLTDALPAIEKFDEKARGLKFLHPVKITTLSDAAFNKAVGGGGGGPKAPFDTGATYQALHLVPSGSRYDKESAAGSAAGVIGFYDNQSKQLVVRGTGEATPFARTTLAHELTHALQDQHFGLAKVESHIKDKDSLAGALGLIEGDARTVERQYYAALSPADKAAYAQEASSAGGSGGASDAVSNVIGAFEGFPYDYGPSFIAALRKSGGQKALDKAFLNPPDSSREVLDPAIYLHQADGVRYLGLPAVPKGRTRVDGDRLGTYGIAVVLATAVSQDTRTRAAILRDGDAYSTWRQGSLACVRWRITTDNSAGKTVMLAAFRSWASHYTNTSAAANAKDPHEVDVQSCA